MVVGLAGFAHSVSDYLKRVKKTMAERGAPEEEINAFQSGAEKFVKDKVLKNFKDFDFYTGESMNPDGMWVPEDVSRLGESFTDLQPGLFFWDTARTVSRLMSLSGSMALRR